MFSGEHRGNSRERRDDDVFFMRRAHKGYCVVESGAGSLDLADLIPNVTDAFLIESFHKGSSFFLEVARLLPTPPLEGDCCATSLH